MSSLLFGKNTITFYIIRIFFSINRPGVRAKVTSTFLEALYQELIIVESIWVITLALLFISHNLVINFGPVLNSNAHKIKNKKTKTIMFLMKNFMLNLFDKISLKKRQILQQLFQTAPDPQKFQNQSIQSAKISSSRRKLDIQIIKPSPHWIFSCCFSITNFKLSDWLRDINYHLFLKRAICKHQIKFINVAFIKCSVYLFPTLQLLFFFHLVPLDSSCTLYLLITLKHS